MTKVKEKSAIHNLLTSWFAEVRASIVFSVIEILFKLISAFFYKQKVFGIMKQKEK